MIGLSTDQKQLISEWLEKTSKKFVDLSVEIDDGTNGSSKKIVDEVLMISAMCRKLSKQIKAS